MSASAQVQFANIQSQYPLDSSTDNDDNAEDGNVCENDEEDANNQGAANEDEGDDENVDDTFNFIMQRRTEEDEDSEATDDDAPSKCRKIEKRSKKKNDSN
ncbi:hypothetical protein ACH5RR_003067 [Cinchona calisaya]|uniref:Uncharacterized protein n=1 Tax=Cinchona calisaya TaxID=153742 RepID=A0ABD3AU46_9GENT